MLLSFASCDKIEEIIGNKNEVTDTPTNQDEPKEDTKDPIPDTPEDEPASGVIYEVSEDGTYAMVVGYKNPEVKVEIVGEYNGLPVKEICNEAFVNSKITSVIIPDSVTSIGDRAFSTCSKLTDVIIGNSVKSIGTSAFFNCYTLKSINIPDSMVSIGDTAFYECSNLTSITIGNSVTAIGDRAFDGCTGLAVITFGDSVKTIGNGAFYACTGLSEITLPSSVISIGSKAFYGCKNLTNITMPDTVTTIGDRAFYSCSKLADITIPSSVTSIGEYTFSGCSSLTDITIPDSVRYIGDYAFINCSQLSNITMGDSMRAVIGKGVFTNCNSALYTEKNCASYVRANDNPYAILIAFTDDTISHCSINENTCLIAYSAFYDCDFTSITIPNSVRSIGCDAFYGCKNLTDVHVTDLATWCSISFANPYANPLVGETNLYLNGELVTEVVFPNGTTSIGNYAFFNCINLTAITIPDSVISIGDLAFAGCSNLITITIPDSVTSLGEDVFQFCENLVSITVDENNSNYKSIDGNLYTKDGETLIHYAIGKSSNSFIIPDGVINISGAFAGCLNLEKVTIPSGVTRISDNTFYHCENLIIIIIPDSVTSIGEWAFYGCDSLTDIYYTGSAEEWAKVEISDYIYVFDIPNATIHYDYVPED